MCCLTPVLSRMPVLCSDQLACWFTSHPVWLSLSTSWIFKGYHSTSPWLCFHMFADWTLSSFCHLPTPQETSLPLHLQPPVRGPCSMFLFLHSGCFPIWPCLFHHVCHVRSVLMSWSCFCLRHPFVSSCIYRSSLSACLHVRSCFFLKSPWCTLSCVSCILA